MSVLIKPLITEKISSMNEKRKYGFVVKKSSNKIEIRKEIQDRYKVIVESVNVMIQPSTKKSKHGKSGVIQGKTSSFKKAIVQVAEGDIIDFYESI